MTCDRSVVFSGSSTNKTDCHDRTEILLKVALNTTKQTNKQNPLDNWIYFESYLIFPFFWQKSQNLQDIRIDVNMYSFKCNYGTCYILILRNWRQGMLILIACASLTLTNLNPVFFVGSLFIIFLFFCVFFWFLSSSCVLYTQCFLCLWIVHYWLFIQFCLTFIWLYEQIYIKGNYINKKTLYIIIC